ncbi:MAG TPA: hypothetical protein VKV25_10320 [Acidimicrobiales bacterium]|nr:hypothetical protein [Acidimicrobiales bacterium]
MTLTAAAPLVAPAGASAAPHRTDASCPSATICVVADAGSVLGPQTFPYQGLLNGAIDPPYPSGARVAALDPTIWRTGFGGNNETEADKYAAQLEWVMSDSWLNGPNGDTPPWDNWPLWTSFVKSQVEDDPASWYDPVNEEFNGRYDSTITPALLDETEIRAELAIRAVDPNAKIVAPSEESYSASDLQSFLQAISQVNQTRQQAGKAPVVFNAISWHELGTVPDQVVSDVAGFNQLLDSIDLYGMPRPSVQINEFGNPSTAHIPGSFVAWASAFQSASVANAGLSCWSYAFNDDCNSGLDGLLETDGQTTYPDYWAHWLYARMDGSDIATSVAQAGQSDPPSVTALATRDDATRSVDVLLGQLDTGAVWPATVTLEVDDFPFLRDGTVTATVLHVPNYWNATTGTDQPLAAPMRVYDGPVAVRDGVVHLSTAQLPPQEFQAGDVFAVRLSAGGAAAGRTGLTP